MDAVAQQPDRLGRRALMAVLRGLVIFAVTLAAADARAVDFSHDVVPILRVHCGKCHTGDAKQGGFSMNTRESLLAGGDSGTPGFVDSRAGESEIIARITSDDADYRMPSEDDLLRFGGFPVWQVLIPTTGVLIVGMCPIGWTARRVVQVMAPAGRGGFFLSAWHGMPSFGFHITSISL